MAALWESLVSFRSHIKHIGIIKFLLHYRLIYLAFNCLLCGSKSTIQSAGRDRESFFRCSNRKECGARTSMRHRSILKLNVISANKFLELIIAWLNKYTIQVAVKEIFVSRSTVCELYNEFRQLIRVWLEENSEKIGGEGHIVEIDESAFGKRKYNRGRLLKTRWVVGGIDRTTKKCFMVRVEKRDKETLHALIQKWVLPGSVIYTDQWKSYVGIEQYGYSHRTVNHSKEFVNQEDNNVHTQNVECFWSKVKRDYRRRIGRMSPTMLDSYLVEYMWRQSTEGDLFENFMKVVNYFYPTN